MVSFFFRLSLVLLCLVKFNVLLHMFKGIALGHSHTQLLHPLLVINAKYLFICAERRLNEITVYSLTPY